MAAERNLKAREMDNQKCEDGNGVRGNIKEGLYSSYAVEVHHLASGDSLAKEVSSEMRMSDEQVAFCLEFVGVCMLDRGIRKLISTAKR